MVDVDRGHVSWWRAHDIAIVWAIGKDGGRRTPRVTPCAGNVSVMPAGCSVSVRYSLEVRSERAQPHVVVRLCIFFTIHLNLVTPTLHHDISHIVSPLPRPTAGGDRQHRATSTHIGVPWRPLTRQGRGPTARPRDERGLSRRTPRVPRS